MLERIERRFYGRRPKRHLVDGGFNKNEDIEWAAGRTAIKRLRPADANSKHLILIPMRHAGMTDPVCWLGGDG